MFLILAGTFVQIDHPIDVVQKHYFHSLIAWMPVGIFFPRTPGGQVSIAWQVPMLGGYAIGLLLIVNLVAAHGCASSRRGAICCCFRYCC